MPPADILVDSIVQDDQQINNDAKDATQAAFDLVSQRIYDTFYNSKNIKDHSSSNSFIMAYNNTELLKFKPLHYIMILLLIRIFIILL